MADDSRRDAVDRSGPPAPGRLGSFRFPDFDRHRLANGVELLAARRSQMPLVSLEILLPAGGVHGAFHPGLATFHAGLLDEGTPERSALEIAGAVEGLGGGIGTGADWDVAYVAAGLLSRHRRDGLELLAEVVRRASFPDQEIDRQRRQRLAEILRRRQQPGWIADRVFDRTVYGDAPYATSLLGTEESVGTLDGDLVGAFYRRHVVPSGTTVLAVGDLRPDEVARDVEAVFADWEPRPLPEPPVLAPDGGAGPSIRVVDRPGAPQTELRVGHVGIPRSHPDYLALFLANAIFGGKFTSRLNLSLRERHGITYGVSSRIAKRRGPGPFRVSAAVSTEGVGTAVRETLGELRRLRDEPVTEEELEETQDYLVGVFPYTLQTIGDLAHRLRELVVHALPDDYYHDFADLLRGLGRDDLLAAARRHLHPERATVVAVGPMDEIRAQLETLGDVVEVTA